MSPPALGCMAFEEPDDSSFMHKMGCPEPVAFDIVDCALDSGINLWDVYGEDGLSERILGRWFTERGAVTSVIFGCRTKDAS